MELTSLETGLGSELGHSLGDEQGLHWAPVAFSWHRLRR
jgi:hypothetical protein